MTGGLASLRQALAPAAAAWTRLESRERRLVQLAAWVLGLFLLWTVALQPAWRTLREAPARLDALDVQLQAMQVLAADVRQLRATPPLPRTQASAALKAATDALGSQGRLAEQGDRAVLTLTNASTSDLRRWLAAARAGARARPVDATLTRSEQGLSGTVVVALPTGGAP
jgi:general secretion pathway protein M